MSSFEDYGKELVLTRAVQKEFEGILNHHHKFKEQYQSSAEQLSHMFGKTVYFEGEPYLITGLKYELKQEIHNPRSELRGKRTVHLSTLETQYILMFELKQSFTETIFMDVKYVVDHYKATNGGK